MRLIVAIYALVLGVIPSGQSYLKQLQPRDSILIADQLEYGFELDDVEEGTDFAFQDYSEAMKDTLTLVRNWQIDTLKARKGRLKIRASIVVAPFEEATYTMPEIAVQRTLHGQVDTLVFENQVFEAKSLPVDPEDFEIHDIKGQLRYPVTLREILPWIIAFQALACLVIAIVCIVMMARGRRQEHVPESTDPPYIVALRRLDALRGEKYWAAEKQKFFYSGITEALRTYIESRFDVNAEEMTTAEIFAGMKGRIPDDMHAELKALFETADFVKFAKYTAPDEQNAKAVPTAVRFVTSTWQEELDQEGKEEAA